MAVEDFGRSKAVVGYHRTYFVSLFRSVYIFSNPLGMSCNVNKYFISVCLYYFCMLAELCVYHSDKYRNVKGFDSYILNFYCKIYKVRMSFLMSRMLST